MNVFFICSKGFFYMFEKVIFLYVQEKSIFLKISAFFICIYAKKVVILQAICGELIVES